MSRERKGTQSVPGEGAPVDSVPLHVRHRDAVLEEAARACQENSGEVALFVAEKGRIGHFFALLLRKMKTGSQGEQNQKRSH